MYTATRRGQSTLNILEDGARRLEQSLGSTVSAVPSLIARHVVHFGNGVLVTISLYAERAELLSENFLVASVRSEAQHADRMIADILATAEQMQAEHTAESKL